jgi:hypothetical protein
MTGTKKVLSADRVRSEASKLAASGVPLPEAIRRLDKKANRPTIGLVSPVYWRAIGEADPIPGKSEKSRNAALARRRKSGVRFEVLAASLSVAIGRKVSTAEVKTRLASAGLDPETSYAGRGTRKSGAGEAARVSAESAKV